jgi:hypothetical protein
MEDVYDVRTADGFTHTLIVSDSFLGEWNTGKGKKNFFFVGCVREERRFIIRKKKDESMKVLLDIGSHYHERDYLSRDLRSIVSKLEDGNCEGLRLYEVPVVDYWRVIDALKRERKRRSLKYVVKSSPIVSVKKLSFQKAKEREKMKRARLVLYTSSERESGGHLERQQEKVEREEYREREGVIQYLKSLGRKITEEKIEKEIKRKRSEEDEEALKRTG